MDSPPSSSTFAQSLWYQPLPTQLSTLCEIAPMSSNSRDDAGVSEERADTVVPTKARKCNKCKKMKCRHSKVSVSSSTKSNVSNPGGHRLDVSPATAVPLPSIEEGYDAPMTTIGNDPPLDSSPNRESIDAIAVGSPTLAQEDGTIPDPNSVRYEAQHATSPPTQHEEQLLNMPDSRSSNSATVSEIPSSDATENAECQPSLPSSVSAWDSFVLRRPQLLQQAIRESVGSGTFHDVDLYAYSTRSKILRSVSAPTVVHARISFLEAPSFVLKDLLKNGKKKLSDIPSTTYDHEHLDDSDLEDDEPEAVDSMDKASDISDIASNISAFDLLDSPQSTAHSVINTGARGVECDSTVEHVTHEGAHREVIYVPFGAARTWRALVLYLYDGSISFSPLQTSAKQSKGRDDVSCSPKSMYSLAKKLELDELAKVCEEAIITDLRASNIIKELFNDFTWRHPAILGREVIVFKNYSQDVRVRSELKQTFQDIASGKLPRRDVVLSALFDNLLPPVL